MRRTHDSSGVNHPTALRRSDIWVVAVVAVAYFAMQRLAYIIPNARDFLAAVWPAGGVVLATLLLQPRRLWPAILAVVALTNLLTGLMVGRPFLEGIGFIAADVFEALGSAWIICRWNRQPVLFNRVSEVLSLLFVAVAVNGISAFLGAAMAAHNTGRAFWSEYFGWWTVDGLGLMLVTPLIVSFCQRKTMVRRPGLIRVVEPCAIILLALVLDWNYFRVDDAIPALNPFSYVLVVPLIWAALRLEIREVAIMLFLLAFLEICYTALGMGTIPIGGTNPSERVFLLQLFIGVKCAVTLLLASSYGERRSIERSLYRANHALQTISLCNQAMVRATNEPALLDEICRIIVDAGLCTPGGYKLVWVGFARNDGEKSVEVVAAAGEQKGYLDGIRVSWGDNELGHGPVGTAIRTRQPVVANFFQEDPVLVPWWAAARRCGLRASVTIPLRLNDDVLGALSIYSGETGAFDAETVQRLSDLVDDLVYGIQLLRARTRIEAAEAEARQRLREAENSHMALLVSVEEQERSAAALRVSEERFRSAMDYSPIGMAIVSLDGQWQSVNQALCRMVGYTADELRAMSWRTMTHPDDLENDVSASQHMLGHSMDTYAREKRYLHKDGYIIWVQVNTSLIWNPDGTPRHFITQIQNVTERRHSQEALLSVTRRYERHEAALNVLSRFYTLKPGDLESVLREITEVVARTLEVDRVNVWVYNGDRTAIECLDLFEQSAGRHSHGQVIKRAGHESYFNTVDSADVIVAADALTDPRTASLTETYLQPAGITSVLDVPLQMRGVAAGVLCCTHTGPTRNWTPDEQTFAVAVANLVSVLLAQLEQQKLDGQLRQTQKLEALGTLAGGIAHDFNNILGAIISFTELTCQDHRKDAELQENLGEVLKAARRAVSLVQQILMFSRRQKQERKRIQLAPVVAEVLKLLRSTLPATIEIQSDLSWGIRPVLADPTQIHQVVMNLCTNAAHAMRGKPGVLRVALGPSRPGHVQLTVKDTGHGIDPATLNRIFDPFFTTKLPGEGTGLGLAVVHGIIKEHNGEITVDSQLGAGTTFRVELPEAEEATSDTSFVEASRPPNGAGQRLLFVDDEVALGQSARRLLSRYGFEVELQHRPDEALALFRRDPKRFAAVLTDLTMPLMTGTELAGEILKVRRDIPVFVMTGYAGGLTADAARLAGITGVVSKPVDYPALVAQLTQSIPSGAHSEPGFKEPQTTTML